MSEIQKTAGRSPAGGGDGRGSDIACSRDAVAQASAPASPVRRPPLFEGTIGTAPDGHTAPQADSSGLAPAAAGRGGSLDTFDLGDGFDSSDSLKHAYLAERGEL